MATRCSNPGGTYSAPNDQLSFISVFESSLKPSHAAESALASHVTDIDPRATYWFPTTLRSILIIEGLDGVQQISSQYNFRLLITGH